MKNSIINLTDEPNDTDQTDRPTKPVKPVAAKPVKPVAAKPVAVRPVATKKPTAVELVAVEPETVEPETVSTEVEESGSAPAETTVPIADLEKESRHRERYLKHIKSYLTADGAAKAPRRLEPNQV